MSSVHSALPNHNMSTPWFPESATIPYAPGTQGKISAAKSAFVLLEPVLTAMQHGFADAFVYMAGQAPSMQIP